MGLLISPYPSAIHFLCMFCMATTAMMDHTERSSLVAFMAGITGDPRDVLVDWNSSLPACNWTGIRCDQETGLVIQIDLSWRSLRGTISRALSALSSLLILDLSHNEFFGTIPGEIGVLSRLQQISLASNRLVGSLPAEFGNLTSLKYLDLSCNGFSGRIPVPLFCETPSLEYIDLSNNSLVGEIPSKEDSCDVEKLRYLLLWSNQLTGNLPRSLANASSLRWIDVESNYMTGDLPGEVVKRMPLLRVLYLSYNNFEKANVQKFTFSLANCTNLHELELAATKLSGKLGDFIGYLPPSLTQLHLEENHFHGFIPPNIANLVNLTMMNLSSNHLNSTIPPELRLMTKLERVCLSNNSLTGSVPPEFGEIQHLGLLDLSRNHLSGPIPSTLCKLSQLRRLLLYENHLSGTIPYTLGNCTNLEILDLSKNMINGRIPKEIAGLESLKLCLNLSSNFLEGSLPLEFGKMSMVLSIDLSRNNLSGVIPPQIGNCIAMEYLNLSRNSFTGQVPSSIGELPYLQSLDLSSNELSGEIPNSLENSRTLSLLNLSFNDFKGRVPRGGIFKSLTLDSFLGNPLLCGSLNGLPPCRDRSHTKGLLLLPIVLAPVILSTLAVFVYRRKSASTATPITKRLSIKKMFSRSDYGGQGLTQSASYQYPAISYRELADATKNFHPASMVGSGRFGQVYKGTLKDGTVIAVKVLDWKSAETVKSFRRECEVLRRTRHRNLIRIITACSKPDFKSLVLPFMENGSLESYLHENPAATDLVLVLSICSDIAEVMAYLHHHSPVPIVHCDLKPSNVLLNEEMTAMVADFGVARMMAGRIEENGLVESSAGSTTGLLVGSFGYIAPEYAMGKKASREGDVYSFGVLVLEIITRRRPTDVMFQEGLSLQEWVKESISNIDVDQPFKNDIFASLNHGDSVDAEAFWYATMELIELGVKCTQSCPSKRPTMIQVADELGKLKDHLAQPTNTNTASKLQSSFGLSNSQLVP